MPKPRNQKHTNDSGLNFEAQLWAAADKMRGHMLSGELRVPAAAQLVEATA
jgi:hypothetical protein